MNATPPIKIKLTKAEQKLYDQIDFGPDPRRQAAIASGMASRALMESLLKRNAIPEARLSFFTDPYPGGHGKSHLDVFKTNLMGRHVFEDSGFVRRYLRYFINGPDLPAKVMERFCEIANGDYLTIDLYDLLRRYARQETRNAPFSDRGYYPEEFYKLALECIPDDPFIAKSIREAAMDSRRRRT
jgi:hypothetical protein